MAAAAVLDQENLPVSATDAGHFAKRNHGVGNRAQTERVYDRIETLIGKGQRLRIHDQEIDIQFQPHRSLLGKLQHSRTQIDGGEVAVPWVVREVLARSDGNLQDLSRCALKEPLSKSSYGQELGDCLAEIIPTGKLLVLFLNLLLVHGLLLSLGRCRKGSLPFPSMAQARLAY